MMTRRNNNSTHSADGEPVWFPAKRYGYGWGFPVAWQGWAVFLAYGVLTVLVAIMPATQPPMVFFPTIGLLTAGLLVICWKKGEKPRWRWGADEDSFR